MLLLAAYISNLPQVISFVFCDRYCQLAQKMSSRIYLKVKNLIFGTRGYNKVLSYSGRDDFVKDICMHYVIYNVHTELSHLRHGLMETLQLKKFAEDHPVELWSLLAVNKKEKKDHSC